MKRPATSAVKRKTWIFITEAEPSVHDTGRCGCMARRGSPHSPWAPADDGGGGLSNTGVRQVLVLPAIQAEVRQREAKSNETSGHVTKGKSENRSSHQGVERFPLLQSRLRHQLSVTSILSHHDFKNMTREFEDVVLVCWTRIRGVFSLWLGQGL